VRLIWLGAVPYTDALGLQDEMVAARLRGDIGDTTILLTHPPVITMGRASRREHMLADSEQLARAGVTVHEVDRGGDVTYHGPGQLVGYPILDLTAHRPDLHWYLRTLEAAVMDSLRTWDLEPRRFPPRTGVWIGDRKIAAIGVKVRRWVTSHGFALNVGPVINGFDLIVPCGIREYGVTSVSTEIGRAVAVEQTVTPVACAIARAFGAADCAAHIGPGMSGTAAGILARGIDPLLGPVLDC